MSGGSPGPPSPRPVRHEVQSPTLSRYCNTVCTAAGDAGHRQAVPLHAFPPVPHPVPGGGAGSARQPGQRGSGLADSHQQASRQVSLLCYSLYCMVLYRGKHLLDTGVWSDCEFIVGLPPGIQVSYYHLSILTCLTECNVHLRQIFHCHKVFLAMASPVFEAMFYGGLAETQREIKILDVQPEAFSAMLSYIYTDKEGFTTSWTLTLLTY